MRKAFAVLFIILLLPNVVSSVFLWRTTIAIYIFSKTRHLHKVLWMTNVYYVSVRSSWSMWEIVVNASFFQVEFVLTFFVFISYVKVGLGRIHTSGTAAVLGHHRTPESLNTQTTPCGTLVSYLFIFIYFTVNTIFKYNGIIIIIL